MQSNTDNEKMIFHRMVEGEEPAFRLLFDLYRQRLYAFVVQMIHSKADAEEIVQEVFLKLWVSRMDLAHVEQPGKYIYTIARNKTLNYLAKAARDKQLEQQLWINISVSENATEEILEAQESRELIHKALQTLTSQKQHIFHLSRELGLSHEEIALKMGLSKSRINNLLVEILRHIKDCLNQHTPLLGTIFFIANGHLLF